MGYKQFVKMYRGILVRENRAGLCVHQERMFSNSKLFPRTIKNERHDKRGCFLTMSIEA